MHDLNANSGQDLTLAGLVHDLSNVFETLGEAADLLSTDPRWISLAGAINRTVEQGRRITASFQESARSLEIQSTLENAIECTKDFLLTTHRRPLEFSCHLEPGLRLAGKPGAWERVFVNLFLNAAQAMPEGGKLEITTRRKENQIEIVVSDTGPGIPQENIDQLFHPGFSTHHLHTGLGLTIVHSIVQAHGGKITAGNGEVCGAKFTILTPALQIPIPQELHSTSAESLPEAGINQRS